MNDDTDLCAKIGHDLYKDGQWYSRWLPRPRSMIVQEIAEGIACRRCSLYVIRPYNPEEEPDG